MHLEHDDPWVYGALVNNIWSLSSNQQGANGQIIAECRDTEIGRKYAGDVNGTALGAAQTWANGYMSSFQAWQYAKLAFDKWSLLVARRFAELRGDAMK